MLSDTQLLAVAAALVATMFGLLCTIIGWTGSRALKSIDDIRAQLASMALDMHDKLTEVAAELHSKINGTKDRIGILSERVTRIEEHCKIHTRREDD